MNNILQPVDDELNRLYEENSSLSKQLEEANKPSVFTPVRYDNLHKRVFIQPGNTGNTGGGSSKPHGTYSIDSGDPTLVKVNPVAPYDNFYFYTNVNPLAYNLSKFEWGAEFSFPTQKDLDACMALEWEAELCIEGTAWNMGGQILLQFDGRHNPCFRLFDYINKVWIAQPQIPFSKDLLAPGEVLKVSSEHSLSPVSENHIALSVNGERYATEFSELNTPNRWPNKPTYLHYSFQLDADGHGTSYSANIGNGYLKVL